MSGYIDAPISMVARSENTVRDSFRGSFESIVQKLQSLFTHELAAISKSFDDSRR